MCGIAGIVSQRFDPVERDRVVRKMAESLGHRGPDDQGVVSLRHCSLGFRRLAIIDPSASSQPFANERGSVHSVANAEIYNAPELRERLLGNGHRLTTRVDTEVLPHLYEELGAGLVEQLEGMYALAVWDESSQTLLLGRDRAGEKPLFYWRGDGELAFASELRALLQHPRIEPVVDAVALRRYLSHDFFPAPHTPLSGIRKLPAGHLLVARGDAVSVCRYWDLASHFDDRRAEGRTVDQLAAELDGLLARAVARRRQSDAPVGVFLSGGIDSTSVLAHLTDQVGPGVPAFTVGHDDSDFDESGYALETSRAFGAELHTLKLGPLELADGLHRVGRDFDEPLGDASTLPTHLLARFASQHVKVVLSGEGADELFAGYPTYLGHRLAESYRRLPVALRAATRGVIERLPERMGNVGITYLLRRFATAADQDPLQRHLSWFGSMAPALQEQLASPRLREHWLDDDPTASAREVLDRHHWSDGLSPLLYLDFATYLQDGLLTKVDRATMLASIEARAPFLDRDLMEFAASVPSRHKLSGFSTKAILRRAVGHRLPAEVLRRRKRGFNIPFSRWLLQDLGAQLRLRFAEERVTARGLFEADEIGRLLDEHLDRKADHRKPLFNLLALDLWCDRVFGEGARVPLSSSQDLSGRATTDDELGEPASLEMAACVAG